MTYPQGQPPYGQQPQQPYGQPYPQQYQQPVPYPQQGLQGRDGAQYVRQQTGHSILAHIFLWPLVTCGVSLCFAIYYTVSPNHYWRT